MADKNREYINYKELLYPKTYHGQGNIFYGFVYDGLHKMKTKLCGKAHLLNAVVYLMGLRILSDTTVLYEFPVRVGQNKSKYLKMGDRMTNFRIKCGESQIIRHERNPDFYNPENGHRFYVTKRDDERITMMPQINGIRNGQMIHPTTNPKTLGMAYSHGCIG